MKIKKTEENLPVIKEETLPVKKKDAYLFQPFFSFVRHEQKTALQRVEYIVNRTMTMAQKEVGAMANRIMRMASHIGVMADRIGEMANRIVHTEHLIVNTAVLIVDFGLILDGSIRNLSHSVLYALSIIFNREFSPHAGSSKHLDVISDNIKQILSQQHEFSLKMLESQKEMRDSTMKTFDKGVQE